MTLNAVMNEYEPVIEEIAQGVEPDRDQVENRPAVRESDGLATLAIDDEVIAIDLDDLVRAESVPAGVRLSLRDAGGACSVLVPAEAGRALRARWIGHRARRLAEERADAEPTRVEGRADAEPTRAEGRGVEPARRPEPFAPTHRIEWEGASVEVRLRAAPTRIAEDGTHYRPAPTEGEYRRRHRARWGLRRDADGRERWTLAGVPVCVTAIDLSIDPGDREMRIDARTTIEIDLDQIVERIVASVAPLHDGLYLDLGATDPPDSGARADPPGLADLGGGP